MRENFDCPLGVCLIHLIKGEDSKKINKPHI